MFVSKFPSVKGAKVVIDANTGRSKGYGFVRFGNDNEKSQAMVEMNGVFALVDQCALAPQLQESHLVFVGGLDPIISEDDLRKKFTHCGEIISVKVPAGKQCGLVQFVQRSNAEEALQVFNGTIIGSQTVRLSWGCNPANNQSRSDTGSQSNIMLYGGQFYNGY